MSFITDRTFGLSEDLAVNFLVRCAELNDLWAFGKYDFLLLPNPYLNRTHSRNILRIIVAVTQIMILEGDLDATFCIAWPELVRILLEPTLS